MIKLSIFFVLLFPLFLFRVNCDDDAPETDYDESAVETKHFFHLCSLNHTMVPDDNYCNCDVVPSPVIGRPAIKIDCWLSDGVTNLTNEAFKADKLPANTVSLILSYQSFTEIPAFEGSGLIELDMSNNLISIIKEFNFFKIKSLERLDLSYNQISEVEVNAFTSLSLLHYVDLSDNHLVIIPANSFMPLTTIKTLKLSGNQGFGRIMGKEAVNSSLALMYQQLGVSIDLKSLEMERCNLSAINLIIGRGLEHLNLGFNDIKELSKLDIPPNVKKIELSGNPLNNLKAFSLSHVYNLQEIIMEDMPLLGHVDENSFYGLSKLHHVSFEGSKNLSFFHHFSFNTENDKNLELKILNLRGCNIRTLNDELKTVFSHLEQLHLDGNPFNCDCDIQWIKKIDLETEIRCYKPPEFQGKLLNEIEDKEMKCSRTSIFMRKLINSLILLTLLIGCSLAIWCFFRQLSPRTRRRQFQKVGPESPYQRVTIEPNRAEYSIQ